MPVIRLALNSSLYPGLNFNLVKLRVGCIKKMGVALFCLVLLLCSVVIVSFSTGLVDAQTGSIITIASDGSVKGTDLIQREGDTYTFTGNIFGTIKVEKDGITIDGDGYAIKGNGNGINLKKDSTATIPFAYGDIVVKNVYFCDNSYIFASSTGNSFTNNVFEGGGIDIREGGDNKGNVIKYNVFIDGKPAIFVDYSMENVATENDFINCMVFLAMYGRLNVDGNYWSNYKILYPDAKEIDCTGIWDTPYTYEKTGAFDCSFVDYNPSVNPIKGAGAPEINSESTPAPTTSPVGDAPKSFLTAIIATVVVSMVIVSTSLLVYFKKRK